MIEKTYRQGERREGDGSGGAGVSVIVTYGGELLRLRSDLFFPGRWGEFLPVGDRRSPEGACSTRCMRSVDDITNICRGHCIVSDAYV